MMIITQLLTTTYLLREEDIPKWNIHLSNPSESCETKWTFCASFYAINDITRPNILAYY